MPQNQAAAVEGRAVSRNRRSRTTSPSVEDAFAPRHAVRCVGELRFRNQSARDLACLLDLDADVVDWTCLPPPLEYGTLRFAVDLAVTRSSGVELVLVDTGSENFTLPAWADEAAAERGAVLRIVPAGELVGDRLANARELLRYAKWRVSLSQRIGLVAALDQEGSLTLVECMSAVRGATDPIGVVAALALRRFVEIDLDSGPLGPETRVTRFRG